MKYKIIFFDVDGVLVEEKYLFTQLLERDFGLKTEDMLPFFKGSFNDCKDGKADLKVELAKVINDWGWQGTVDELVEYWLTKGTQVNESVLEFAGDLKESGYRLFITTTQEKYRGERLREMFCKNGPFEEIFFSAELGVDKKDSAFWELVWEKAGGTDKFEAMCVDDDFEVVKAAKQFGIGAHFYSGLSGFKESLEE